MKKNIFAITTLIFLLTLPVSAEVELVGLTNVMPNTLKVKNPFESQLPKKDKVTKKTPDVKPKPTPPIKPEPKPDQPQEIIPPKLSISGLIFDADRPQAIINGEITEIGDIVSDAKIVAIKKEGIDIIYKEKQFTVNKPKEN